MQHPSNRYCPAGPEITWGAGFPCVAEISCGFAVFPSQASVFNKIDQKYY